MAAGMAAGMATGMAARNGHSDGQQGWAAEMARVAAVDWPRMAHRMALGMPQ
eukprot:gene12079-2672_t